MKNEVVSMSPALVPREVFGCKEYTKNLTKPADSTHVGASVRTIFAACCRHTVRPANGRLKCVQMATLSWWPSY